MHLSDALGCVLDADVVAPDDVPPVAIAAQDGYALRASDGPSVGRASVDLPVTHDVLPGGAPTRLMPGTAARIARGGTVPFGADAVFAAPTTQAASVTVVGRLYQADGVIPAGADARAGEVLAPAGTQLAPGHVAALASCGIHTVLVRPAPRVVIIAVGSELASHASTLHVSQRPDEPVQETSGALLAALVAQAGGRIVRVETVADDAQALRKAVDDATLQADLILTVGGTSDDWHDVVTPVLEHALGIGFHHVRLGAGGRHGVGSVDDGHGRSATVIALPGHPLDVVAAFMGYVRQALLALRSVDRAPVTARAASAWASPFGFAQVLPVRAGGSGGGAYDVARVVPASDGNRVSLRDLASADGLALIDESVTAVSAGDAVEVWWWER